MKITAAVVEHKGGKFHMRDDIEKIPAPFSLEPGFLSWRPSAAD